MAMKTQYGGLGQWDRMNMVTWIHRMLPDVDTDLPQLSIPATVSLFKPLTSLDYHVHSALAADIHFLALRTIFSQAVCSKARKFLWWVLSYDKFCCWKIRNPNHQQKIMKEKPRIAALSQLGNFETENTASTYEAFQSPSCCNSWLKWFPTTCSQPLETVIMNWYKSRMTIQIVVSCSNPFLWHCTIDP